MMNYDTALNPRVCSVPPSGIRKFFDLVAETPDAISLGVGEPDFVTPYAYRHAAIRSIEDGQTQYTGNLGVFSLRQAIAEYMKKRFGVAYNPTNEILVTVGVSEGIDIALRALVEPGDEVLVPEPSYVSYAPCVLFANGTPVPVVARPETACRITAEAVRKVLTPRTKAIILPYPNNPTGAIMERKDLEAIAEALRDTNLVVISDEVYAELTYDGLSHVSFASLPGMWERTVTLNGFSKAFAMTGWRVGYACAPSPLLTQMNKIHQYVAMCASRQGQVAAEAAIRVNLRDNFEDVEAMRRSYDRRRRLMIKAFEEMGLPCFRPQGAFYVFPDISVTGLSSQDFCKQLLARHSVACVPGDAFGESGGGHIRCCYATSLEKLQIALSRIAEFVQSTKSA